MFVRFWPTLIISSSAQQHSQWRRPAAGRIAPELPRGLQSEKRGLLLFARKFYLLRVLHLLFTILPTFSIYCFCT